MRNSVLNFSATLSFMAGTVMALLTGWQTSMTRRLEMEAQLLSYFFALGYLAADLSTWVLLTAVADIAEKLKGV